MFHCKKDRGQRLSAKGSVHIVGSGSL
jgi:hypothetical protein